jgi:hypothetical protein
MDPARSASGARHKLLATVKQLDELQRCPRERGEAINLICATMEVRVRETSFMRVARTDEIGVRQMEY